MKKRILTLCCCILGLGTTTLFAQSGAVAAGGDASGAGGSASFSIGQIFYASPSSSAYNLNEGLQQPFEISTVTGLGENVKGIELSAIIYPNPTVDVFTLKVESSIQKNLSYGLYDTQGKLISENKVTGNETQIEVTQLAPGHYFLKVSDGNLDMKTFKIVKSY